jgi:signal transduction histidine kinase
MDELSGYLRKLAAAERIEDFESVRLSQHGTRVDVSVGLSYIRDGRGRIIGAASIGRDISKRKRAEQALRESEQELQRLTVSLLNLQDTERRRLARELHDVTAQNVFATSLNLARLQRGHLRPAEAETLLADSRQLCEQALQEIRTLSYLLHPPTLDQTGLFGALRWYVEGFVRRSGINVDISSIHEVGRLPGDIETALFRVVQESLTNISRHSGSTTAAVSLTMEANEVILHVTDHGRGMSKLALADDNGHGALGVGIPGMRQRLRQFGGVLLVDSDERGTVVTARVPVANVSTDADPVVVKRSQANA